MFLKPLVLFAVVSITAAFSFAQLKKPDAQPIKLPFEKSLQAVVVTTDGWNSIHGKAVLVERKRSGGEWKPVSDLFPVVVGRSGLGADLPNWDPIKNIGSHAIAKREGDGRAPAGFFPLTSTFGNADVGSKLPFTRLEEFTECVDDTNSAFYNKIVDRMQVGNFDWKSSEKMKAVGPQYDLGVFVAYNSFPAIRGNGSCIFLHIWKDADTGTAGCTAMARENLERIIKWLDPSKIPYLVQTTEADYKLTHRSYKLPKLN